jgi:hypothetical protein
MLTIETQVHKFKLETNPEQTMKKLINDQTTQDPPKKFTQVKTGNRP